MFYITWQRYVMQRLDLKLGKAIDKYSASILHKHDETPCVLFFVQNLLWPVQLVDIYHGPLGDHHWLMTPFNWWHLSMHVFWIHLIHAYFPGVTTVNYWHSLNLFCSWFWNIFVDLIKAEAITNISQTPRSITRRWDSLIIYQSFAR